MVTSSRKVLRKVAQDVVVYQLNAKSTGVGITCILQVKTKVSWRFITDSSLVTQLKRGTALIPVPTWGI